ncbi:unnamed protein product [Phytophthora lilii]|uniref:Unnamed protein product n=1 Tax=Phytophthora lilii TaxID=2077276 RepID=A0A9W6TER8_9STRA|nr:unnamed protein product [Phytophthora lilii]
MVKSDFRLNPGHVGALRALPCHITAELAAAGSSAAILPMATAPDELAKTGGPPRFSHRAAQQPAGPKAAEVCFSREAICRTDSALSRWEAKRSSFPLRKLACLTDPQKQSALRHPARLLTPRSPPHRQAHSTMPLGDKLGRPFELLSLIGRKRKDEPDEHHHRLSGAEARAYANATGAATSGYTHGHCHSSHSSSSSSFYPAVKYERITPATQPAPVVQYERLTPGSAAASAPAAPAGPDVTHPSPLEYEAAARDAAFPSPDLVPSAAVASSSFRSTPSPALSSLPSPGMLTPLTPAVGATPTPVGRSPVVDSIRVRPPRSVQAPNLASPAQPPVGPAGAPSAPFSSVMEEWMSQLRTPTPDVTLLPSPYDFNKDTPTPMDTNSMDLRRLQDALLPTPPPDVHDQRQHPKNSAYVTTRGPRPLLEDIASLCRDLNSQDLSGTNRKGMLPASSGQMETKYTSLPARPLRAREESISSAYSDDGESQAKMLAAAAALSSVSSMGEVCAAVWKDAQRALRVMAFAGHMVAVAAADTRADAPSGLSATACAWRIARVSTETVIVDANTGWSRPWSRRREASLCISEVLSASAACPSSQEGSSSELTKAHEPAVPYEEMMTAARTPLALLREQCLSTNEVGSLLDLTVSSPAKDRQDVASIVYLYTLPLNSDPRP